MIFSAQPVDTSLLLHFFGRHGNRELKYDDFFTFMDNLQTEVSIYNFFLYLLIHFFGRQGSRER
jgi:hypothetical protein